MKELIVCSPSTFKSSYCSEIVKVFFRNCKCFPTQCPSQCEFKYFNVQQYSQFTIGLCLPANTSVLSALFSSAFVVCW